MNLDFGLGIFIGSIYTVSIGISGISAKLIRPSSAFVEKCSSIQKVTSLMRENVNVNEPCIHHKHPFTRTRPDLRFLYYRNFLRD